MQGCLGGCGCVGCLSLHDLPSEYDFCLACLGAKKVCMVESQGAEVPSSRGVLKFRAICPQSSPGISHNSCTALLGF